MRKIVFSIACCALAVYPARTQQTEAPPARRVGDGVSAPSLLTKVEPRYSEEARAAGLQGTVLLYVVIEPDGRADRMRVLRPLGSGLDEEAMDAVRQWKFRPGMKDGAPVPVEAQIEVNFRLLNDPDVKFHTGPGVSSPAILSRVAPEYSEQARAAQLQGKVILTCEVDAAGLATNIVVARSLGMGLDEKAVEALKQWRFQPGTNGGQPVAVPTTIEMSFRLK